MEFSVDRLSLFGESNVVSDPVDVSALRCVGAVLGAGQARISTTLHLYPRGTLIALTPPVRRAHPLRPVPFEGRSWLPSGDSSLVPYLTGCLPLAERASLRSGPGSDLALNRLPPFWWAGV
jgi:hypothetical protein